MAAREGLKPDEFWALTPREWAALMKGRRYAERREAARSISLAWHTAGWSRSRKRLPNLATLLRKITGERAPEQTPRQAVKMAEVLNAMFGGEDKRSEEKRNRHRKG